MSTTEEGPGRPTYGEGAYSSSHVTMALGAAGKHSSGAFLAKCFIP
jgi:hypothetical protein